MNTAKDRILKLIDDLSETKAGEVIDFILYLKTKDEQDLYLSPEEEDRLWNSINTEERISSEEVKKLLIGESDE